MVLGLGCILFGMPVLFLAGAYIALMFADDPTFEEED